MNKMKGKRSGWPRKFYDYDQPPGAWVDHASYDPAFGDPLKLYAEPYGLSESTLLDLALLINLGWGVSVDAGSTWNPGSTVLVTLKPPLEARSWPLPSERRRNGR